MMFAGCGLISDYVRTRLMMGSGFSAFGNGRVTDSVTTTMVGPPQLPSRQSPNRASGPRSPVRNPVRESHRTIHPQARTSNLEPFRVQPLQCHEGIGRVEASIAKDLMPSTVEIEVSAV